MAESRNIDEATAEDAALLDWKPSLKDLRNVVVPRVSSNWKTIGLNLDIEDCRLSAIAESEHYKTDACCTEMFSIWLSLAPHTGSLPLTWRSVLSAIEKVERVTSEELLAELKRSVKAPLPRAPEPTHQATIKLAGELKAYYKRLEPVVQDAFTPTLDFVELAVVQRQEYGLRKKKNLDDFLHAAVHGIDEIYQASHPMEYCQILTLENGPATGKHILISGAPGCGKTTLVSQLCKDLSSGSLPNDYTLVVLVELRELILFLQDKEEAKLHHLFSKFEHKADVNLACRELEQSDGRGTLLVLDGFDELDARMRKCRLLSNLLSTKSNYLPECDILVTTRPVAYPDLLGLMRQPPHRHIEVLGFAEDCIASFVRSYFKPTQHLKGPPAQPPSSPVSPSQSPSQTSVEHEAEKLLNRLDQLPHVKGMCRTPVVLKIVCRVCELLGGADNLPTTMTGIYEEFILRQLLENGPAGTKISSILDVPPCDYPFFSDLCRVAFECCTSQKLIISKEDIGDTQPQLIRGTIYGLLEAYPVEDLRAVRELMLYHFMHKTVQEALAACHLGMLSDAERHLQVWRKWFGCPEMAEVWKFYCGLTKLEYMDISDIVQLAYETDSGILALQQLALESSHEFCSEVQQEVSVQVRNLLVVSLFEAGNATLAQAVLPHFFFQQLCFNLATSYETAAYAFALENHKSVECLHLCWTSTTRSVVNLQLLLDVVSCHPTVRTFHLSNQYLSKITAKDCQALCQFLSDKHRLAKVKLFGMPAEVLVAALSTESSTMDELECLQCCLPEEHTLIDSLRNTSLKCITIEGGVGDLLHPILRALTLNTNTVDRTVRCLSPLFFSPPLMSRDQLHELKLFLQPCVKCNLSVHLALEAWGALLSGVEAAGQLEQLRVHIQSTRPMMKFDPEWDRIDRTTLDEVEKSWAHSRCREVVFDVSTTSKVFIGVQLCTASMEESTLDAITKLLGAVVKGIIQRKDSFVFELHASNEQISMLREVDEIVQNKCAVAIKCKKFEDETLIILEMKPHGIDL